MINASNFRIVVDKITNQIGAVTGIAFVKNSIPYATARIQFKDIFSGYWEDIAIVSQEDAKWQMLIH